DVQQVGPREKGIAQHGQHDAQHDPAGRPVREPDQVGGQRARRHRCNRRRSHRDPPSVSRMESMTRATMTSNPMLATCSEEGTAMTFKPFFRTPTVSTPNNVPGSQPLPRSNEVPPTTTAATASNSMPIEAIGCPA